MIPATTAIVANFGLVLGVLIGDARLIIASCAAMAIAIMWTVATIGIDAVRNRLADAELAGLRARAHEVRVMSATKTYQEWT
jgi:hypothetical protein